MNGGLKNLMKRGDVWYIRYKVKGKLVWRSLKTADLETAQRERDSLLLPLQIKDALERRNVLAATIKTQEERLAEATWGRNRVELKDVWKTYPYINSIKAGRGVWGLSVNTVTQNQRYWGLFVKYLAEYRPDVRYLDQIQHDDCNAYSIYLLSDKKVSARTHNLSCLIPSVVIGKRAGLPDPFKNIPMHRVKTEHHQPFTMEQVRGIVGKASEELKRLIVLAIYTGLRMGDSATLRWEDIVAGEVVKRTAKTGVVVRFPVHPSLQAILDSVPMEKRGGYVCPTYAAIYARDPSTLSKIIKTHLTDCGFECNREREEGKRRVSVYSAHSFRHTFATLCAEGEVPLGLVQSWLGHGSDSVTSQIYTHYEAIKGKREMVNRIPTLEAKTDSLKMTCPEIVDYLKWMNETWMRKFLKLTDAG